MASWQGQTDTYRAPARPKNAYLTYLEQLERDGDNDDSEAKQADLHPQKQQPMEVIGAVLLFSCGLP